MRLKAVKLSVPALTLARLDHARGTIPRATYILDLLSRTLPVHIDANGKPCATDPNQLPLTKETP